MKSKQLKNEHEALFTAEQSFKDRIYQLKKEATHANVAQTGQQEVFDEKEAAWKVEIQNAIDQASHFMALLDQVTTTPDEDTTAGWNLQGKRATYYKGFSAQSIQVAKNLQTCQTTDLAIRNAEMAILCAMLQRKIKRSRKPKMHFAPPRKNLVPF